MIKLGKNGKIDLSVYGMQANENAFKGIGVPENVNLTDLRRCYLVDPVRRSKALGSERLCFFKEEDNTFIVFSGGNNCKIIDAGDYKEQVSKLESNQEVKDSNFVGGLHPVRATCEIGVEDEKNAKMRMKIQPLFDYNNIVINEQEKKNTFEKALLEYRGDGKGNKAIWDAASKDKKANAKGALSKAKAFIGGADINDYNIKRDELRQNGKAVLESITLNYDELLASGNLWSEYEKELANKNSASDKNKDQAERV